MTQRLLLGRVNRFARPAKIGRGYAAHLDEDKDIPATANEIDLAPVDEEVAVKNAVPMPAQKSSGNALTIVPRLLRRFQDRRRNTLVSGETLGDELHKGRER